MRKKLKFMIPRSLIDSKEQAGVQKIVLLEENELPIGAIVFRSERGKNFEGLIVLEPSEKEKRILNTIKAAIKEFGAFLKGDSE